MRWLRLCLLRLRPGLLGLWLCLLGLWLGLWPGARLHADRQRIALARVRLLGLGVA